MLHIVETAKDVDGATHDLEDAAERHKFGVLHIHDLKAKLHEKGVEFGHACKILEVCNPQQASRVLSENMAISMALPCRISVYEEGGRTRIATMLPTAMLAMFPGATAIKPVAEEVEHHILQMIDEAR